MSLKNPGRPQVDRKNLVLPPPSPHSCLVFLVGKRERERERERERGREREIGENVGESREK
jgi:hypothetical protein